MYISTSIIVLLILHTVVHLCTTKSSIHCSTVVLYLSIYKDILLAMYTLIVVSHDYISSLHRMLLWHILCYLIQCIVQQCLVLSTIIPRRVFLFMGVPLLSVGSGYPLRLPRLSLSSTNRLCVSPSHRYDKSH